MLREHLTAALNGRGSVALIGGEAGLGKSALAEAVCREAEGQGALVLTGRAFDLTKTPPYGLWVEAFGCYRQDEAMPPLPEAFAQRGTMGQIPSQAALFQDVADFLSAVAAQCLLVLLLEDLHWADPASLDLMRFIARTLANAPLLVLAVYRADELSRRHPLSSLLPLLAREAGATRLDLRPLAVDAIPALLTARYPLSEADSLRLTTYLFRRAEGNAFFTVQLLRSLEEERVLRPAAEGWLVGDLIAVPLPMALRQVIDARLARLGDAVESVLAVAAVIGQEVSLEIWASVAEVDTEALSDVVEQVAAAHLMVETPDGMHAHFGHALIREALYEGMLPSRRRRLHCRIADALTLRPHPDPDAVAYHLRQAGDERAVEWLVRAGKRAERTYAFLTAADRYREAAALLAERDPVEAGWLLVSVAWLRRWADVPGSIATLTEAEQLARAAGDPLLTAAVHHYRGILRCRTGDYHRGLAEVREGVAGLDRLRAMNNGTRFATMATDNPRKVPGHLSSPVMWLAFGGHLAEAIAIGERIIAAVPDALTVPSPDANSVGNLLFGLGMAYGEVGRIDDARAAYAHARRLFSSTTTNIPGIAQSAWHELSWLVIPCMTEVVEEQERLAAITDATWAQASGALPTDDPPQLARLPIMALRGEWNAAWEIGRAVRASGWYTEHRFVGIATLATLARYRGETDLAWTFIEEWLPAGPTTPPGTVRFHDTLEVLRLAAALAIDQGDHAAARGWLEAHDRWLAWSGAVLGRADGVLAWAVYHHTIGDTAQARECATTARTLATEPRQPLVLLAAHRLLGELAVDCGRTDDASAHLDAALALADGCGAPWERALTLMAMARLCATRGAREAAATLLVDAESIFASLGALPDLVRAREAGARLHMSPVLSISSDGLTRRELDVVRAIAAGMSNREIADALSISVRTVNRHIENLYRKIDARSKVDATAWALRHDLA
jgi:DNA-binding CsgD family transcriptional regulator/tetratricopeptide (TPR) repeat protein